MDFNHDADNMWDWQCQEFDLGDETALDISESLLNEGPTDDFACMFGSGATPVKACGDMVYYVNNSENIKDLGQCKDISLQMKRRRMLRFESVESRATLGIEDIHSSLLQENESQKSLNEGISEMSQWVSGFADGTSTPSGDVDEGWLSDCLIDSEMQLCSEDMNINSTDAAEVYIDIADISNTLPEHDSVHAPPVRIRGNVAFKGKKSNMRNSEKLPSSVVYPFAFVKPCSVEGELTLMDINKRIRNPTSKLKEKEVDPLADYPTSAISGKPVVGKTKIHTVGGKGSITILRTKG